MPRHLMAELSEAQPLTTVMHQLERKEGKEKSAASVQPGGAAERLLPHVQDQPGRDACGSCRSSTRRSWSPIRVPMPVCSQAQWQRRSGAIFPDCKSFGPAKGFAQEVLAAGSYKTIAKTRYVNDKQITDHYAIIPTGQGFGALASLSKTAYGVYATVVRRFLSIFYPPAEFSKVTMVTGMGSERFFYSFRVLLKEGYFKVAGNPYEKKKKPDVFGREYRGKCRQSGGEASFGLEFFLTC